MKRYVILQNKTSKWWQIFFSAAHVKNQKRFLSTENTSYKRGRKKHLTVGCNRWQYNIQALKHGCAKITQWKPQGLQRKMGVWEQHAKELSRWHILKNFKTEPYSQHMLMVENSYRLLSWPGINLWRGHLKDACLAAWELLCVVGRGYLNTGVS